MRPGASLRSVVIDQLSGPLAAPLELKRPDSISIPLFVCIKHLKELLAFIEEEKAAVVQRLMQHLKQALEVDLHSQRDVCHAGARSRGSPLQGGGRGLIHGILRNLIVDSETIR